MRKGRVFWLWLGMVALLGAPIRAAADLGEIIDRMPTADAARTQAAMRELVALGPAGVRDLCGRLKPPEAQGDVSARFALSALAHHVARPGAEGERERVARALCAAIVSIREAEIRAFLIRRLQQCGGEESLAPLSALLEDDRLVDPALRALLAIDAVKASPLILAALDGAGKGARAQALVRALGEARYPQAVEPFLNAAKSQDPEWVRAAQEALATIGVNAEGQAVSSDVLLAACKTGDPLRRAEAMARCLRYARTIADDGAENEALRVARAVWADARALELAGMQAAALNTLVDLAPDVHLDDLKQAVLSADRQVSVAAIQRLQRMHSRQAADAICSLLRTAPDPVRMAMLEQLDEVSAPGVRDAVSGLLQADVSPDVCIAAVSAAPRLLGGAALSALFALLADAGEARADAVRDALLRLVTQPDSDALSLTFEKASAAGKVALLDVIGQRALTDLRETVFGCAALDDAAVRQAALKSLGEVARPDDLPRLLLLWLDSSEESSRKGLARAIARLVGRETLSEQAASALQKHYARSDAAQRARILALLPELGGNRALAMLIDHTGVDDAAIADAAVRALSRWPDVTAAAKQLDAVESVDSLVHKVLLIRGFVRLANAGKMPVDTLAPLFVRAMELAPRAEEKEMLEGAVARNKALQAKVKALQEVEPRDDT